MVSTQGLEARTSASGCFPWVAAGWCLQDARSWGKAVCSGLRRDTLNKCSNSGVAGAKEYPRRALQPNHGRHFAPRCTSAPGGYCSMWTTVVPATSAVSLWYARDPATGVFTLTWDHMFSPDDYPYYMHTAGGASTVTRRSLRTPPSAARVFHVRPAAADDLGQHPKHLPVDLQPGLLQTTTSHSCKR